MNTIFEGIYLQCTNIFCQYPFNKTWTKEATNRGDASRQEKFDEKDFWIGMEESLCRLLLDENSLKFLPRLSSSSALLTHSKSSSSRKLTFKAFGFVSQNQMCAKQEPEVANAKNVFISCMRSFLASTRQLLHICSLHARMRVRWMLRFEIISSIKVGIIFMFFFFFSKLPYISTMQRFHLREQFKNCLGVTRRMQFQVYVDIWYADRGWFRLYELGVSNGVTLFFDTNFNF